MKLPKAAAIVVSCLLPGWAQVDANLKVAPASLDFTVVESGPLPAPLTLSLVTVNAAQLEFSLMTDGGSGGQPPPSWLSLGPRRAATPALILVHADQSGMPAGEAPAARIVVTNPAGVMIAPPIPVRMQVVRVAPRLEVLPGILRPYALLRAASPAAYPLWVRNSGSGSLGELSIKTSDDAPWLRASVDSCAAECRVSVQLFPGDTRPGGYRGAVNVTSGIGTKTVPVSLFIEDRIPALRIAPGGAYFEAGYGQTQTASQEIRVYDPALGGASWQAEVVSGGTWLRVDPPSGEVKPDGPAAVRLTVSPAGLPVGVHYALVRFNVLQQPSPQFATVVLRVRNEAVTAPVFSHNGILFRTVVEENPAAPLRVTLYSGSQTPLKYQSGPLVNETLGTSWLTVAPAREMVSDAAPRELLLSAAGSSLPAGIYTGRINVSVDAGIVRAIHTALIIAPGGPACTPTRMVAVHTGLPEGFSAISGAPAPVAVELSDDCGKPVRDAALIALFSSGDAAIALEHTSEGVYAGTWVPMAVPGSSPEGRVAVTVRVWHPRLRAADAVVTGVVEANTGPVLFPASILHNMDPRAGLPLAPGTATQLYGADLAPSELAPALVNGRLPSTVLGSSVLVGPHEAPIYYAGPGQFTFQLPMELLPFRQYQVLVRTSKGYTAAETISINPTAPGIATYPDGRAIAQDTSFRLIDYTHPAVRGEYLTIYLCGMGAVSPPVPSGAPPPEPPIFAITSTYPQVTLAGKPVDDLYFSGLTPCCVGLYQLIFQVPRDIPAGNQELIIRQGDSVSNKSLLPIR